MSTGFTTPKWVKDAVFYQIFPDRFARSRRMPKPSNLEPWDSPPTVFGFKGGDLLGVAERVDYLQELGYKAWWDLPALPKFNTDAEAVRRFIFDVARHWIEFGIDGWRLDVPHEIDDDVLKTVSQDCSGRHTTDLQDGDCFCAE